MSGILTLPDILEQPLLCMQILQPIQNVFKVCKKRTKYLIQKFNLSKCFWSIESDADSVSHSKM